MFRVALTCQPRIARPIVFLILVARPRDNPGMMIAVLNVDLDEYILKKRPKN